MPGAALDRRHVRPTCHPSFTGLTRGSGSRQRDPGSEMGPLELRGPIESNPPLGSVTRGLSGRDGPANAPSAPTGPWSVYATRELASLSATRDHCDHRGDGRQLEPQSHLQLAAEGRYGIAIAGRRRESPLRCIGSTLKTPPCAWGRRGACVVTPPLPKTAQWGVRSGRR